MTTAPISQEWEEETLAALGLNGPPFAELTSEAFFFPSDQHLRAMDFMRRVLCSRVSAGVITGDKGAGKSLLARSFISTLDDRFMVAHVQRQDLSPREFLLEVLRQFGVPLEKDDRTNRRLLLSRYLMHQAGTGRICLVIVENAQAMHPTVLEELHHIAAIEAEGHRLIKLLLLGRPMLNNVVDSPRMRDLVPVGVPRVNIGPMSEDQVAAYVVHRLYAAGAHDPDKLIPHPLMAAIHALSRGIPAEINRLCARTLMLAATEALDAATPACLVAAAEQLEMGNTPLPDTEEQPPPSESNAAMLLISTPEGDDSVVPLRSPRILLGRGELADVSLDSAFVSRYHALIVREPGKDILIDLGSTNGMLVNSKRVVRRALQNRDLIQIGPVRVTYLSPTVVAEPVQPDTSATVAFARNDVESEHTVFAFGRFDETA